MADSFGQADLSKNFPVPSSSGIDAEDYHEGREMNLVPEKSFVLQKNKEGL